jgi:hypothetical protein
LLHGFGFASVLADMGLPQGARMTSLLAFNLGIEAGQLSVVLAIMPWGSAAIAVLATVWLVQRAIFPG